MRDFVKVDEVGPLLYKSWANFPVHRFSYTLAKDVDNCGEYTKLSRFQGLTSREDSAAMRFGACIEDSVVDHYKFFTDPIAAFRMKWKKYEQEPLKYSKNDGNWPTLNSIGEYLMKEFLREKENLPIRKPQFGVILPENLKQTWYNGTRLEYIADCISDFDDERLLIDFKTSGRSYSEREEHIGYAALDPQLRTGALVSGIRKVCFIVFVKTKTPRIQVSFGTVTNYQLDQIDLWLKEQYHKLLDRKLVMRAGVRFPDDHCLLCEFLCKCLGRDDVAERTLRHKESEEVESLLAAFD